MSIKKTDKGYLIDLRPYGSVGPRIRKTLPTKGEAQRFEAFERNKAIHNPWNPQTKDHRKLSELIELWWQHHGQHLTKTSRRGNLDSFCKAIGNPEARLVKPESWLNYREERINKGSKKSSLNTELLYIKAVFNRLRKLELINYDSPLKNTEPFKLQEQERDFLSELEIQEILQRLKNDCYEVYVIARGCLETGGRWSEIENLTADDIKNGKVTFKETKSKKIRRIPISKETESLLLEWSKNKQIRHTNDKFAELIKKYALKKNIYQSTHILRHTFASHFIKNGGNILTLQKILGHANITTTMIYAHLSAEHLQDARTLNPIAKWTEKGHFLK
ncbi:MAG: phage integrase [Pseudomonadales bacterium]